MELKKNALTINYLQLHGYLTWKSNCFIEKTQNFFLSHTHNTKLLLLK